MCSGRSPIRGNNFSASYFYFYSSSWFKRLLITNSKLKTGQREAFAYFIVLVCACRQSPALQYDSYDGIRTIVYVYGTHTASVHDSYKVHANPYHLCFVLAYSYSIQIFTFEILTPNCHVVNHIWTYNKHIHICCKLNQFLISRNGHHMGCLCNFYLHWDILSIPS